MASTVAPSTTTATPPRTTTAPRNIIGPLTSVYVPNPNCNSCTFTGTGSKPLNNDATAYWEYCGVYFQETLCTGRTPLPCMPHVTAYSDIEGASFFYSPGLHCPRSWRTVAVVSAADRKPGTTFLSRVSLDTLLPDETVAICCYSDLEYFSNGHGAECMKTVTSTSFEYNVCTTDAIGTRTVGKTITDIGHSIPYTYQQNGNKTITALFSHIRMYAPTIQLNWRPQDRREANSTSVTSSAGPTTSGGGSSSEGGAAPTDGSNSTGGSEDAPPTLSQAAVAGIAAGGAIFVIGVGLLIFALWFRRRKKRKASDGSRDEKPPLTPGLGDGGFHKAELPSTGLDAGRDRFHKPELEAPNRFEMGAQDGARLFELYGDEEFIPGELPAGGGGGGGGGGGPVISPRSGPPPAQTPPPLPRSSRGGPRPARPGSNNKTNTNASTSANTGHARDPAAAAATPAATAVAKPTLVHVHRKAVPARGTALRAHPPEDPGPARHRGGGGGDKAVVNTGRAPRRVRGGSGPAHDRGSIEGGWI